MAPRIAYDSLNVNGCALAPIPKPRDRRVRLVMSLCSDSCGFTSIGLGGHVQGYSEDTSANLGSMDSLDLGCVYAVTRGVPLRAVLVRQRLHDGMLCHGCDAASPIPIPCICAQSCNHLLYRQVHVRTIDASVPQGAPTAGLRWFVAPWRVFCCILAIRVMLMLMHCSLAAERSRMVHSQRRAVETVIEVSLHHDVAL